MLLQSFYLYAVLAFCVALIRGFEKGKKSGYTVFGFLGVIIALLTFKSFGTLSDTLVQAHGMGKPEVLGQSLGLLLTMALGSSVALGAYSLLFMIVKFNKKDLIPEICSVVTCGIIATSSILLVGALNNVEEKYAYPAVSIPQARLIITLK